MFAHKRIENRPKSVVMPVNIESVRIHVGHVTYRAIEIAWHELLSVKQIYVRWIPELTKC